MVSIRPLASPARGSCDTAEVQDVLREATGGDFAVFFAQLNPYGVAPSSLRCDQGATRSGEWVSDHPGWGFANQHPHQVCWLLCGMRARALIGAPYRPGNRVAAQYTGRALARESRA